MNPRVMITKTEVLSDNWYVLRKVTFDYHRRDGSWQSQSREAYDRGNGATILLYDRGEGTVILTRQFRLPTYVNGNPDGLLVEACAGLLDQDSPEECITRETQEETGFRIDRVVKIGEAYMSPGSVTEMLHFFVAEYSKQAGGSGGGGLDHEQEDIEVLELPFGKVLEMIDAGEIKDAKTILLLRYAERQNLLRLPSGSLHILVAGPYRSGTGDDPKKVAANLDLMNQTALEVYRLGHLPVLGEWYALPLLETAGARTQGDEIYQEIFHPSSVRLLDHCDAVLRIGGPSTGADEMVRIGRAKGKRIFSRVSEICSVPGGAAPHPPDPASFSWGAL